MYLEVPKKIRGLKEQAAQMADHVFRSISRKYDKAEHAYPVELDMIAAAIDGMNDGNPGSAAGATSASKSGATDEGGVKNGGNLSTAWSIMELCRGDVGLLLSMPRQGLGNAAIAAVASHEQKQRLAGRWAAMAITEPACGSDSAAIRTTAKKDGDHYLLNGEKIFVTSGDRADCVVVWASLDKSLGRAAIKSFVVEKGYARSGYLRAVLRQRARAQGKPAGLTRNRCPERLCRGHGNLRQYPPAGSRHGRWLRPRRTRPRPRTARSAL